jgi:hypothetical protein
MPEPTPMWQLACGHQVPLLEHDEPEDPAATAADAQPAGSCGESPRLALDLPGVHTRLVGKRKPPPRREPKPEILEEGEFLKPQLAAPATAERSGTPRRPVKRPTGARKARDRVVEAAVSPQTIRNLLTEARGSRPETR